MIGQETPLRGHRRSGPLLRALNVYRPDRIDLAEACLVACAQITGVNCIASFNRSIDRVGTLERREPAAT